MMSAEKFFWVIVPFFIQAQALKVQKEDSRVKGENLEGFEVGLEGTPLARDACGTAEEGKLILTQETLSEVPLFRHYIFCLPRSRSFIKIRQIIGKFNVFISCTFCVKWFEGFFFHHSIKKKITSFSQRVG